MRHVPNCCQIFQAVGSGHGPGGALASRQFRGYGRDMILSPALKRAALVAFTVAGLGSTVLAQGQDPVPLGKFGDSAAYTYKTASGKVCYVVSSPQGSEPNNANRDPIFF